MHDTKITLTHLNIRQSIIILLLKLVLTDIILAFIVIGFYFVLVQGELFFIFASRSTVLFLSVFSIIGILKIGINIYTVLQWLNEYYEITPKSVIHKRGVISKKTEKYNLDKVRALKVEDTFFGELCNFATLTLYDIRLNKYLDMYLIHNPNRYAKILQTLRPKLEIKTVHVALPFKPKTEIDDEIDE